MRLSPAILRDGILASLRHAGTDTIRKAALFGGIGALGCLLGALVGEPLFRLIPSAREPGVDVLFVLDATSSMQGQIDGVQRGIMEFAAQLSRRGFDERVGLVAFRDEFEGESPDILDFGGSPFTADYIAFSRRVSRIHATGGGDVPESSYDAIRVASRQPFRDASTRVLVLITDAPPLIPDRRTARIEEVLDDLDRGGVSQVHLVIRSDDRHAYTPLQATHPGEVFDLATVARGTGGFDRLLPVLGEKIAAATMRGLASSAAVDRSYAPRQLGITAIWTGLLACGVALALVAGQNHYLHRPLLTPRQAIVGLAGGMVVGSLAGGLGQLVGLVPQFLLPTTTSASSMSGGLVLAGLLIGWALLGGLLGRGLAAFVPNLGIVPATLGGVGGGLAAAVGFLVTASMAGDLAGRFLGASLLGFCIGVMIALVEAATRDWFLEVRYGLREIIRVSLGDTPVTVGGDRRACTVLAPTSHRPLAYKYWVVDNAVHLLDFATERVTTVGAGDERTVGTATLTVRSGTAGPGGSAGPRPPAPAPPPPPPPARPQAMTTTTPTPHPPVPAQRPAAATPVRSAPSRQDRSPPPPPPPPPKR